MDIIIELLNLEDPNITVSDISIEGNTKFVTLETKPSIHFCSRCCYRMHSKGIRTRKVNHPILQDTYSLILVLKQRRWKCTNTECGFESNESFNFVKPGRRNTNAADFLIVDAFRDLNATASSIAKRFNTTDTNVLDIFDRYVHLDRLPLTDAISVDEVHIDMDPKCRYALVIQDFHSGDPIDILISRRNNITEPYFASIPKEERYAVKYLISDMYNPYIKYVNKYFPNAVSVVDSFHVIQWIVRELDTFLKLLMRRFKQRDDEKQQQISLLHGRSVTLPISDEVYLLKKYRWLILMNQSSISYHYDTRFDFHFRYFMNTYDYESKLMDLNPHLRTLRDYKEMYVRFNSDYAGDPVGAAKRLDWLIQFYYNSNYDVFIRFAALLSAHRDSIINSFIMTSRIGSGGIYDSRLSNGPIESMNRKVKDLKRIGRGFRNFEHLRNRFLFSTRKLPVLNGSHH